MRRVSRTVTLKGSKRTINVGGDSSISIQSMTNTRTSDIDATLQQIAELTAAGCDIVRVAVPTKVDVKALKVLALKSPIPLIADIHFQGQYAIDAILAGCAGVRINPGNIRSLDTNLSDIVDVAKDYNTPIRIGINMGSLDKRFLNVPNLSDSDKLVKSALYEISLFEKHNFYNFKISVKHSNVLTMIDAYRKLSKLCEYPLHLGVTEAGPLIQGTVKSVSAISILLNEGIGDTIRISLSTNPVEEVKVASILLQSLGLRKRGFEIISCPSCGRAQIDLYKLVDQVVQRMGNLNSPIRIAVMGCIVNGPGEAREADIGVSAGNKKGYIFIKGKIVKTVPEEKIVDTLYEESLKIINSKPL